MLCHLRRFLFLVVFLPGCALMDRTGLEVAKPAPFQTYQKQYRGAYHIHTIYSRDSKITLKDVVTTAQKSRLDFVIIADHNSVDAAEAYRKSSLAAPPLMIFGAENTTVDGHLVTLGVDRAPAGGLSANAIMDWVHEKRGYAVLAHPLSRRTPWKNPDTLYFDGLEVYNFAHSLRDSNSWTLSGRLSVLNKRSFLNHFQKRPDALLDYWDRKLESGKYSGWGAVDAHIRHKWFGWPFENERLQFQSVTMVALADRLETKPVLDALASGRSFMVFESRGIATGFSFTAQAKEHIYVSGENVFLRQRPVFLIRTPERARIVLVNHGGTVFEYEGREAVFPVEKKGAYRVEVYRGGGLWILSNPIYIE